MRIYNYDPITHEFLSGGVADESPLELGQFLIPANATATPPPALKPGESAIFDGDKWRAVADYRGRSVCALDADGYYAGPAALALGEIPDARRILTEQPNLSVKKPKWSGKEWIDGRSTEEVEADALASAKAELRESDSDMARIAEDLITALISKGVLAEADIPKSARDKMAKRSELRSKLA